MRWSFGRHGGVVQPGSGENSYYFRQVRSILDSVKFGSWGRFAAGREQ